METLRSDSRSTTFAAGAALALAGTGAALLVLGHTIGFTATGTETIFTLLWMTGWVLTVGAVVVGVAAVVHLVRRSAAAAGRVRLVDLGLIVAASMVVVCVIAAYPPIGSGAGIG